MACAGVRLQPAVTELGQTREAEKNIGGIHGMQTLERVILSAFSRFRMISTDLLFTANTL
jgi:hypothetical protein